MRRQQTERSCCVAMLAIVASLIIVPRSGGIQAQDPLTGDQATLVVLAPKGPIFADLRVSVARLPYRTWIGRFLARQLDADRSGTVSAAEAQLTPPRLIQFAGLATIDELCAAAGLSDPLATVSTSDFADWFSSRLPKSFDLIAQPQSADDAVRLSTLIDSDDNGTVSSEELQAAMRELRFRDLDNDDTWSVSELVPYRDPRSANSAVTPDVVELPFFHVTDEATALVAAERIVARYGRDGRLAASVLRQTQQPEVEFGVNEVTQVVRTPAAHLVLDVRLSDNAGTSDVDVVVADHAADFCSIRDESFGQTTLLLDGLPLKVLARGGGRNNRAATRGFIGQTFVMSDADRNQYLDEAEFGGMTMALQSSGAAAEFSAVDRNGDKMVTRDELFGFIEREQTAVASRIEVMVAQDGKTLFGLLDTNSDRRLSQREFRSGSMILSRYDLDGDGRFAETELGTEYVLTLGLGRSEMRRQSGSSQYMAGMMADSGDAILSGTAGLSGPEWFKRMDRNQDGDVSRREFHGTAAQFAQLDQDGDGLMTAAEAEAAEGNAAKAEAAAVP